MAHMVLVTGATGLLGNNIVRHLLQEAVPVRVLVRAGADPRPLHGLSLDLCAGDVRDPQAVGRAVDGTAAVVHAAGDVRIGWSWAGGMWDTNVVGTQHVAQAARERGVRMLHISSVNSLALPAPGNAADEQSPLSGREIACNYVLSKRAADDIVRREIERGLDGVLLHPGFMLGPWDWKPSSGRMYLAVVRQPCLLAPPGGCSVCDARDVSEAAVRALWQASAGRQYILAGENISYLALWRAMCRCAGARPPGGRLASWMTLAAGLAGDLSGRLRGSEPLLNSAVTRMGAQFHYYDSRRAAQELNYRPRPLEETLRDAWQWLQQQHRAPRSA